ncbi:MAG TPA: phytoene/squalene synthase family protein [Polyangiaceae bacterium]|jgi:phytoene synthase|nr:phytoene/squalene synthase family protein [Polyangiaceae bacterium]
MSEAEGWAAIRRHSRSFSLAARLLPAAAREDAVVLYAWCRRADDAIDRARGEAPADALLRLRRELEQSGGEPLLVAFRRVLRERQIPLRYPLELLDGMEMDVHGVDYRSLDQLLEYCYRVASTVGLMMCHVMGVSHPAALRPAAHLGIAMQLTNICRDVSEDWGNGRLYLPADVLQRHGLSWLRLRAGPFPAAAIEPARGARRELLELADRYYRSSDAGLAYLSPRCALAVEVSRRVYSAIGRRIERQGYDVSRGRAIVPRAEKLLACAAAALHQARSWLRSFGEPFQPATLEASSHGPELLHL